MRRLANLIFSIKWKILHFINLIIFRLRRVEIGQDFKSFGIIFIRGRGKIKIADNVRINSCRESNPIGGDIKTILFAKNGGEIIIGKQTGISNATICSLNRIEIENNVLIGGGCKIYDNDFHSLNFEDRLNFSDYGVKSKPVIIRTGAFIGAHSIILKGVKIGRKSIIGAGSVVTKDVPDGEIWAGNPARYIKNI